MKSFADWLMVRVGLLIFHKVSVWSSLTLIAWSTLIFWNSNSLDANVNYRVAVTIFDEENWQLIVFTIGCSQLVGVLSGNKWIRFGASSLAAWVFFTLGYTLISAAMIAPGSMVHFGWGFANLHSMMTLNKRRKMALSYD